MEAQIKVRVEAVIFNDNDELLLARHERNSKSYWVLPGGGVQQYEPLDIALARELNEELGIEDAKVENLIFVDEYINEEDEKHIVKSGFSVSIDQEVLDDISVITKDESIKDINFFTINSIQKSKDIFYPSKNFFLSLIQY